VIINDTYVRIAGKKKTCIYVEEKVCKRLVNRDAMLKTQSKRIQQVSLHRA